MQANSDALSYSQGDARCCHLNMTYFKRSKRSDKGQHQNRDFDVENIYVKLQNDTGNCCRVIVFIMHLDLEIVWKFKKVTQRSMLNTYEIFYVQNIHVKLQHDTGNLRKVIAFTRSFQMLPAWKFIKVTQRSRSNLV